MENVHNYYNLENTEKAAIAFSITLAEQKGVASEVKNMKGYFQVLADDGKYVDFFPKKKKGERECSGSLLINDNSPASKHLDSIAQDVVRYGSFL